MIIRKRPLMDTQIERQIITGLIISDRFINDIQLIYRPNILRSAWANTIANWCIEFYKQYKKPPKSEIQDIFRRQKKTVLSPEQADLIEQFLASISQEYETGTKWNAEYYFDQTKMYFRMSNLENVRHELTKCLAGGRIEDGESLIAKFERVAETSIQGINPFSTDSIIKALEPNSPDKLFKFHGPLGDAIGDLERGFLFSILGNQGAGKTWWLMYIALRALFSGCKVLFISLEMSEKQMTERIQHWVTGLPTEKYLKMHNGYVLIPVWDCIKNQNGICDNGPCLVDVDNLKDENIFEQPNFFDAPKDYKPCTECMGTKDYQPTSWYKAVRRESLSIDLALKKGVAVDRMAAVKANKFRLVQFPSGKISISEIETYMNNLEYYSGFLPDVIISDYPDKFRRTEREHRHGINEIWEAHKSWAQSKHCLVVGASQGNTVRTGKDLGQGSWADDIRKLGLIDVGMGINRTPLEKNHNIYRIGTLKQRHDEADLIKEIMVLSALHIGRPYIRGYEMKKINKKIV